MGYKEALKAKNWAIAKGLSLNSVTMKVILGRTHHSVKSKQLCLCNRMNIKGSWTACLMGIKVLCSTSDDLQRNRSHAKSINDYNLVSVCACWPRSCTKKTLEANMKCCCLMPITANDQKWGISRLDGKTGLHWEVRTEEALFFILQTGNLLGTLISV